MGYGVLSNIERYCASDSRSAATLARAPLGEASPVWPAGSLRAVASGGPSGCSRGAAFMNSTAVSSLSEPVTRMTGSGESLLDELGGPRIRRTRETVIGQDDVRHERPQRLLKPRACVDPLADELQSRLGQVASISAASAGTSSAAGSVGSWVYHRAVCGPTGFTTVASVTIGPRPGPVIPCNILRIVTCDRGRSPAGRQEERVEYGGQAVAHRLGCLGRRASAERRSAPRHAAPCRAPRR